MPKDKNIRTARQKDADELHMTSTLSAPSIGLLTLIESNTASIDTTLDISLSVFRDAILGASTKDFSTIQTVLDSIKDTDGIKKITDAVTLNSLPTGDNVIGRVKVTDGTDILLIDGSGRITVVQAEKDRTISGNVGLLTSGDVRINPAKEDGNLASIKTNTDNLNITTSAFRDAIRGANTKDFSTIQTVLDSIKDTDGIKKINDAVTLNSLPTGDNVIGRVKVTDGTNTMPTMDVVGRAGLQKITDGTHILGIRTDSGEFEPDEFGLPTIPALYGYDYDGDVWKRWRGIVFDSKEELTMLVTPNDGTNLMPAMDAVGRPGYVKITDGTDTAIIETDDDDIAGSQKTLTVINLNYAWDESTDKWVRMTQ